MICKNCGLAMIVADVISSENETIYVYGCLKCDTMNENDNKNESELETIVNES